MKCVFFARLSIRRAAACLAALLFVFCLAPANARAAGRADELIALVNTAREKKGLSRSTPTKRSPARRRSNAAT